MILIKYTSIFFVFIVTFLIGYLISKKYSNRVMELKEIQMLLDILENKIKFTYEPLKEIFLQMNNLVKGNIGNLVHEIENKLENDNAEIAWKKSIKNSKNNLEQEDIQILENLFKMLGKTDKEGQVSQIELAQTFITTQIKKAEKNEEKNAKLYKTLGATVGLALVIILI